MTTLNHDDRRARATSRGQLVSSMGRLTLPAPIDQREFHSATTSKTAADRPGAHAALGHLVSLCTSRARRRAGAVAEADARLSWEGSGRVKPVQRVVPIEHDCRQSVTPAVLIPGFSGALDDIADVRIRRAAGLTDEQARNINLSALPSRAQALCVQSSRPKPIAETLHQTSFPKPRSNDRNRDRGIVVNVQQVVGEVRSV